VVPAGIGSDGHLFIGCATGPCISFASEGVSLRGDEGGYFYPYDSIFVLNLGMSKDFRRRRVRAIDSILNTLLVGGFSMSRYNGAFLSCAVEAREASQLLTLGRLPEGPPERWFGAAVSSYFEVLEGGRGLRLVPADPAGVLADLLDCRRRTRWRAFVRAEKLAKRRVRPAGGR